MSLHFPQMEGKRKSLKKSPKTLWTKEEDEDLMQAIKIIHGKEYAKLGTLKWTKIKKVFDEIRKEKYKDKKITDRSPKHIREHYTDRLNPSLIFKPFTAEEDEQIIQLYRQFGGKWTEISKHFQGRSPTSIKNRYNIYLQKNSNPKFVDISTITTIETPNQSHQDTSKTEVNDAFSNIFNFDLFKQIEKEINFGNF